MLAILLLLGLAVTFTLGKMLAPFLAAIIIAYLLEAPVQKLDHWEIRRNYAVYIVFLMFVTFLGFLLFGLFPILSRQISQFFQEVPYMVANGQELLLKLPHKYPELISEEFISDLTRAITSGFSDLGQKVLSFSLVSITTIITMLVYLVLVPFMVFFFLRDKVTIVSWSKRFLPNERRLLTEIWREMDNQFGNYIRGKSYEIFIVFAVAFILFRLMDLNYATLLALIVGVSVVIPYVGAAVVTLPVALVGYFQWGLDGQFMWLIIAYLTLQFMDGNILVPLLFSDTVNLHPVAIILAILVFGGFWGVWGVFFAIPLATLVKLLINIWPITAEQSQDSTEGPPDVS